MKNINFNGIDLENTIKGLPPGDKQMTAFLNAIARADEAEDARWRLLFRYDYAFEATFHDDPPKAIPVAAEFGSIFEEFPDALPKESAAELYLMITQMAIDPMVFLPQIPMTQWEDLMQQFYGLVKKYHIGLRTYWWQMCRFWQYLDKEKAFEYFERFWKTGRDGLSDCRACERSYAVQMSLLVGDKTAADNYAKPLEQGRIWFCNDTPQLYWLAYLEYAMNQGDLQTAQRRANSLFFKGNRDKSDLNYLGAVLRCWAFTDLDRAIELIQNRLIWTIGLWDQKKVYDFYKGAWVCFCELAKKTESYFLQLPEAFPLYQKDGLYYIPDLASWFYTQASNIGRRFDLRNHSDYFAKDLALAGGPEWNGNII